MSAPWSGLSRPPERSRAGRARVRAGLAAFLHYVAEEPALARTCMVEALSAGPAAVEHYEESQQAFVSLFRLGRDVSPHGGGSAGDTRGSDHRRRLLDRLPAPRRRRGGGDRASCLPELVEFALTPYLGAEAAGRLQPAIPTAPASPRELSFEFKKLAS